MIQFGSNHAFFFVVNFYFFLLIPQLSHAVCGDSATLISSVQGVGAESPLEGEIHTVEAVVTASFQSSDELQGFFVQEELSHQDDNIASSEGLFVFYSDSVIEVGQIVRLSGKIQERFGQTQLTNVSELIVCDTETFKTVRPTVIRLPIKSVESFESHEGMLVRLKGKLVVTDNYNLGRFGEIVVSHKERLVNPTQVVEPGPPATEFHNTNSLNRLIIDDGSNSQNTDPIVYPAPELSWHNTLRVGQNVKPIIGVLAYAFGQYRIYPTKTVRFKDNNSRPESSMLSDDNEDSLMVASFNLQNYFNGDGLGGGFPTTRGADSYLEFHRQGMKLGRAIAELGAAIIGIAELENDGYRDDSAIASLTNTINTYAYRDYKYINPGFDKLGSDEITVGLVYQPERVTPTGPAMTLSDPPFNSLGRQPLAQTFVDNGTGFKVLLVMNHFKSKSCRGAKEENKDQGDGQGCFNATRVESAHKLLEWIDMISQIPNVIILGDLNSYAQEDPIQALEAGGYRNKLGNLDDYTYMFDGQAGVLDYTLYSDSMNHRVKSVKVWHINADEPRVLDYNEEFKSIPQLTNLYSDNPYRSSDHDPVYMTIKFNRQPDDDDD